MKLCPKCKVEKSVDQYHRHSKRYDGLQTVCKDCERLYVSARLPRIREKQRQWRADNPDRCLEVQLRNKFGITLQDYRRLLDEQDGKCAICGETCRTGKRLAVDHDHSNGKVRGLLCQDCNTAIGLFRESPRRLMLAMRYVASHKPELWNHPLLGNAKRHIGQADVSAAGGTESPGQKLQ